MALEINTQFKDTKKNRGKLYAISVDEDIRTLGSKM